MAVKQLELPFKKSSLNILKDEDISWTSENGEKIQLSQKFIQNWISKNRYRLPEKGERTNIGCYSCHAPLELEFKLENQGGYEFECIKCGKKYWVQYVG